MLKLLAVLAPVALWFSSAAAEGPILLSASNGLQSSVSGSVSGSETSRYNLAVFKGRSVSIKLSSDLSSSCSLGIVEPPSVTPFFEMGGGGSTYKDVEVADRMLQIVAYPSRDAFIGKNPCHYTITYQVN